MIEPDLFDLPQEPRKELASLGKVIDVLFKKNVSHSPQKVKIKCLLLFFSSFTQLVDQNFGSGCIKFERTAAYQ